jgi:hypothetical protein
MRTGWQLTCDSQPGGGVILTVVINSRDVFLEQEMPFDRDGAAQMAMSILHKAGISEATFSNGKLTVREAGR